MLYAHKPHSWSTEGGRIGRCQSYTDVANSLRLGKPGCGDFRDGLFSLGLSTSSSTSFSCAADTTRGVQDDDRYRDLQTDWGLVSKRLRLLQASQQPRQLSMGRPLQHLIPHHSLTPVIAVPKCPCHNPPLTQPPNTQIVLLCAAAAVILRCPLWRLIAPKVSSLKTSNP